MKDFADFCINFAIKNGADYAEARLISSSEEGYFLKNSIPEGSSFTKDTGMGIRIYVDGGLGFLSVTKFDKTYLKTMVKETIKIAKLSSRTLKNRAKFSNEKTVKANWKVKQKIKLVDIDPKEKMRYLIDLDKLLADVKNKIPSRFFSVSFNTDKKYYVNSEGTQINSEVSLSSFFYSLVAVENGNIEQRYYPTGISGGWEAFKKLKIDGKVLYDANILVKILKEAKSLKKEKMDIILSPELVGIAMHESCGHPGEADRILGREAAQAGESYLNKNWIGKRIGSDVVTVVDDPRVENSSGFYKFDDEGVEARERVLIKEGKINEFLHNRATASQFGVKSNAAARSAGFNREPLIRMATTFMKPRDHSFEEMIEGVKKGVYIKSYTEWNIDDKRWNGRYVGCEAYLIENGRLKGLVRRPVLEITTKGFFSSVDACGKRKYLEFIGGTCGKGDPMQGMPVWMGGPFIRLRNVRVGSR